MVRSILIALFGLCIALPQPTLARTNASWVLHHNWATADGRTLYTCVKRMRREFAKALRAICPLLLLQAS